jgi:branched-chain amino acid transport system substrate-binding protein
VVSDFPAIVSQMRQLGVTTQITSYQTAFSNKMIQDLGQGAEGIIVTSLAPSAQDNANLEPYLARWRSEMKREPNGLPYTQYWYDSVYIAAELYRWLDAQKLPATGENMRKALLAVRTFQGPLTNETTFRDDHTVEKTTYFWQVKGGKFVLIGNSN